MLLRTVKLLCFQFRYVVICWCSVLAGFGFGPAASFRDRGVSVFPRQERRTDPRHCFVWSCGCLQHSPPTFNFQGVLVCLCC